MENKALVTGGAGFIGSNLVDGLIDAGFEVVVADNLSSGKREYLNPQARFYEADVTDQETIKDIFEKEKFDFVFHLAAQISVADSVADPMHDNLVNAQGSFNIFEASRTAKVKKIIFISTGGALYGDVTEPAREELPVSPSSPYAIHKFTAENYLEFFRNEYGLDSITLRLANVYGPRQFKGGEGAVVAVFTNSIIEGKVATLYGDGSKTRDFVFVGDVVSACLLAMKSAYSGMLNIGTGQRISMLDLIKTIEKVNGNELAFNFAENRPGEVRDSILNIEKAKKELGWSPKTDLEAGLRRTLDWVRGQ
jgi:UDP-glucose 4-epimerase